MLREPFHLSDEDLLLVLDGELSHRRAKQARAHLTGCWSCRSRLHAVEGTIADFVSLHQSTFGRRTPDTQDAQPPTVDGARALLKARLREEAARPPGAEWLWQISWTHRAAVCLCLAACLAVLAGEVMVQRGQRQAQPNAPRGREAQFALESATPNPNLTPGATRPINIGDACSMQHEEVVREVPTGLRQQVFEEYGIVNPRAEDYEVDYLIAPGLGGAEDIHNLWPEPSRTSTWNAHLKDELEERLHQLVCGGELDLPTAQQAIATDWITAYKKYLGEPGLSVSQVTDSSPRRRVLL
jgi:hypothetical protein